MTVNMQLARIITFLLAMVEQYNYLVFQIGTLFIILNSDEEYTAIVHAYCADNTVKLLDNRYSFCH